MPLTFTRTLFTRPPLTLSSSLLFPPAPPPFLFFSRLIVKELQRPVEHALALIGYLNFQFEKEVAILEGNSAGAGTADEVRVVQCAVCSVRCAVCSLQCAVCSVRCLRFRVLCVVVATGNG